MSRHYWLHRTLCDVLEDMRRCDKTKNYASLEGLIEEAQTMGNRMEAALGTKKDIPKMQKEWHELRDEISRLRRERAELGGGEADEDRETLLESIRLE